MVSSISSFVLGALLPVCLQPGRNNTGPGPEFGAPYFYLVSYTGGYRMGSRVLLLLLDGLGGPRAGCDARVEELVPRVGQAGQAPVDAVGVGLGVGLLLGREQLPLAERVHGGVRVLAQLRQRGDVDEVDGHPAHRREHLLRAGVEAPVRAHVQRRAAVRDRQRLHRALDAALVAPRLRPARARHDFQFNFDMMQRVSDQQILYGRSKCCSFVLFVSAQSMDY
ncbi:hypothetical protein PR202_ga26073 [Eleusine coracana subsp. coracana]|uniref:Uncharacterized protein n=1 Tax=Eleusine coracana subsp. coracana TaxID=191504 RepID=A0AAV5DCQ9_ELECO|nr:hypothetical protein PR202_ga26073 [Eleusine coracana subsp. coracana]